MSVEAAARPSVSAPAEPRPRRVHLGVITVIGTIFLLLIGLLVVYPILILFLNSFQVGQFGTQTHFGLENWTAALSNPKVLETLKNTITLSAARQGIAIVIGVLIAWFLARTDLPGRNWLEFGFWIAVFLPTLTVTLGWIMVFDNYNGLANQLWQTLFGVKGPFNIFSYWGIVWVHLVTGTIPLKVMLLTPAFRNLDATLEEASRAAGASTFSTLRRVVLPIITPTILVVLLLGTIRSFEAFEIELVLGYEANIDVYSTLIYRQATSAPPQYGQATVLGMLILVVLLPAIIWQQWYSARHSVATVTSKFKNVPQRLGAWRWPVFGLIGGAVLIMTVLPVTLVVLGTFMNVFGMFNVRDVWTLKSWQTVLHDANFVNALLNSVIIAGGTALLAMLSFGLIAYLIVRTRFYARSALDFLVWLPSTLPGIVMGLGYLYLFLGTPFLRPIYGTTFILILVAALGSITLTTQVIKTNLRQLGAELEEASATSGGNWWHTLRHIVVPLLAPSLAVVGVLAFSAAARATSHVALLSTHNNQPLSILQLNLLSDNNFEAASVIGVFILLMTVGVAIVARIFGLRLGPEASR
ncbi:MAG TPA: iron ABC transporter permease [Chloroflexota bacterium]|jgi:iron(III) transport system permease protein|nr:iron ABC transporter permease [Chloroflexota bacterium]